MKEMSITDWLLIGRLFIGSIGIIIACVLGILDLHRRLGRWPWEKR
jgi:hypothetical protein